MCLSSGIFYAKRREYKLLICLNKDSFIREFGMLGEIGYIANQLTKRDKIYDMNGRIFLQQITRQPKALETITNDLMKSRLRRPEE